MGWYNNGDGMMNGSGYAIFAMILMLLFFVVLIWVVVRTVDHGSHSGRHGDHSHRSDGSGRSDHSSEALAHLNMRLAKGEIPADEYNALKEHLKR